MAGPGGFTFLSAARRTRAVRPLLMARIAGGADRWATVLRTARNPGYRTLASAFRRGYETFVTETASTVLPLVQQTAYDAAARVLGALTQAGLQPVWAADTVQAQVLADRWGSVGGHALVADMMERTRGAWQKVAGEDRWVFDPYAVERAQTALFTNAEALGVDARTLQADLAQLVQGNDIDYQRYGLDRTDLTPIRTTEYRARRVAVNEAIGAGRDATLQALQAGGLLAATWTLSPAHRVEDDCDELAQADRGLGPGIYTLDAWPDTPHPVCACLPGPPFVFGEEAVPGQEPPAEEPAGPREPTPGELAAQAETAAASRELGTLADVEPPTPEQIDQAMGRLQALPVRGTYEDYQIDASDQADPGTRHQIDNREIFGGAMSNAGANEDLAYVAGDWVGGRPTAVVSIDPRALEATQEWVFRERVEQYINPAPGFEGESGPINVVKSGGHFWLLNGHHRAAAARLLGLPRVVVNLWDLDAAGAPPWPRPTTPGVGG